MEGPMDHKKYLPYLLTVILPGIGLFTLVIAQACAPPCFKKFDQINFELQRMNAKMDTLNAKVDSLGAEK